MLKKALLGLGVVVVVLVAVGAGLYLTNGTPSVSALSAGDIADPAKPYVVKLHAQWCPICMVTKGVWSEVEEAYAGRVNMVVWDFTDEATTQASYVEAKRMGLGGVFEEYSGGTGFVIIVDGRTKQVSGEVGGVGETPAGIPFRRDFDEYRVAIDEVLTRPSTRTRGL